MPASRVTFARARAAAAVVCTQEGGAPMPSSTQEGGASMPSSTTTDAKLGSEIEREEVDVIEAEEAIPLLS